MLKILTSVFVLALTQQSAMAQYDYDPASVLLASKHAKLIVIGEVESLGRAYSRPEPNASEGVGDYSEVVFRVREVLKGSYSEKLINVYYASHMGMRPKSKWILVLYDSPSQLMAEYERKIFKLKQCSTERCFSSSSSWLIHATEEELPLFRSFLKSAGLTEKSKQRVR
jgi:hypothetical protein